MSDLDRYYSDVGFVKHGDKCFEDLWSDFCKQNFAKDRESPFYQIFEQLYQKTCFGGTYTATYMITFVNERIHYPDDMRMSVEAAVHTFFIIVYSSAWRCAFLEAIDKAGIELALYGNKWDKHKRLGHLARGPVDRVTELNYVYNYNKINLHIHHHATMHQRVVECALAGGFMIIADHLPENDDDEARKYFQEDTEVVFARDPDDMVTKCHRYLGHYPGSKGFLGLDISHLRRKVAV